MEKVCIVKRRQQYAQEEAKCTVQDSQNVTLPPGIEVSGTVVDNRHEFPGEKTVEECFDNSRHVVSITMTQEQSNLLQKSEYIKDLLDEKKNDPILDVKLNNEGRIILKLHLNNSLSLRMLRCDQVCQMLQISRSFLQKLIHENKLKSYKIGRLRRFLLEDILEFLLNKEKFAQFKEVN
jgi:excisionase family DNA binding protein